MKTYSQFREETQEPTEALKRLERLRDRKINQQYKDITNPQSPPDALKPV